MIERSRQRRWFDRCPRRLRCRMAPDQLLQCCQVLWPGFDGEGTQRSEPQIPCPARGIWVWMHAEPCCWLARQHEADLTVIDFPEGAKEPPDARDQCIAA